MWWAEDFETGKEAYYRSDLESGRLACERLLSRPGLPGPQEEATRRNATWYTEVFPSEHLWERSGFFNPSIAADPNGNLQMILRSANYILHPGGFYEYPPEDGGVIKTVNYLADVSVVRDGVEVGDGRALDDAAVAHRPAPFPVEGLEDCRLFWFGNWWWVTGTVRDRDEAGICTMMSAQIVDDTLVRPHQLSNGHGHDKNWMPVIGEGSMVDRVYPLLVRSLLPSIIIDAVDAPYLVRHCRGGAQVLWWEERRQYLGLVHESISFPEDLEHWRCYTHRWLVWDPRWQLKAVSFPFVLGEQRDIEFAAGMVRVGDDLLVSYGQRDATAHLIRVHLSDVAAALNDHPTLAA